MNKKLNVIVNFHRYRAEIKNLLQQNLESAEKVDFNIFLLDIDKLLIDIRNEKQSLKKGLYDQKMMIFIKI